MASNIDVDMSDEYFLPRNAAETKRLDKQHTLFVKNQGYLLHPSIVSKLPARPRIADLATGTSIFLRELAQQLPAGTFDGFDISDAQFPTERDPKIALHVADAKRPYPASFHGLFDVVNIRLLGAAMFTLADWRAVSANAAALLRPGGSIQWIEPDLFHPPNARVAVAPRGSALSDEEVAPLRDLVDFWQPYVASGHVFGMDGIPAAFGELGLDLSRHVVRSDVAPETTEPMTAQFADILLSVLRAVTPHHDEEGQAKIRRIEDGLPQCIKGGAYFLFDVHVFIGTLAPTQTGVA